MISGEITEYIKKIGSITAKTRQNSAIFPCFPKSSLSRAHSLASLRFFMQSASSERSFSSLSHEGTEYSEVKTKLFSSFFSIFSYMNTRIPSSFSAFSQSNELPSRRRISLIVTTAAAGIFISRSAANIGAEFSGDVPSTTTSARSA